MSRDQTMSDWECGICLEAIDNQPHTRIAADMAIEEDIGGVSSLMKDEIMLIAAFHTECVSDTEGDEDLENVIPYLKEARSLREMLEGGNEMTPQVKASHRSHLRVLNGGARQ